MGFKRRLDEPIELSMQAHGAGMARTATVQLRSGACVARISSRQGDIEDARWVTRVVQLSLPTAVLPPLRDTARAILAAGNTLHRDQFAQQGVTFSARSRASKATADFHIDIGRGTTYDATWDLVFGFVGATVV